VALGPRHSQLHERRCTRCGEDMWVRLFERRDVSYRAQRPVRHVWLVVRAVKEPTGWLITTALKRSVQSVPTVATSSASRQRQVRWASAASLLAIPPCGRAKAHLHPGHEPGRLYARG
jgi:hypothetical protein